MKFTQEIELEKFEAWSEARETLNRLIKLDKCQEIEQHLEDLYCDSIPTETDINNFLWFETDFIIEYLGLTESEFYGFEEEEEEEE